MAISIRCRGPTGQATLSGTACQYGKFSALTCRIAYKWRI